MKRIWVIALVAACTHGGGSGPSNEPDAGASEPTCGDGVCDVGETREACPMDCARCGDLVCSPGETGEACPVDCPVCGDSKCDHDETLASCEADCSVCGDDMCTGAENPTTCPHECKVCGDGLCTADETTTCPADCVGAVNVPNQSSFTITGIYIYPCGSTDRGANQIAGMTIAPGAAKLFPGVPPGCWNFHADGTSGVFWDRFNTIIEGGQTFTWTLTN